MITTDELRAIQSIRDDLASLRVDIALAQGRLVPPVKTPRIAPASVATGTKSDEKLIDHLDPRSITHNPLSGLSSRLSFTFRLGRSSFRHGRGGRDPYKKLVDKVPSQDVPEVGSPVRRGSDDSDKTLVDSTSGDYSSSDSTQHSASEILDILAPLVSALQRATTKVATSVSLGHLDPDNGDDNLRAVHRSLCEQLADLVEQLHFRSTIGDYESRDSGDLSSIKEEPDEHDLEMRELLLDALKKKIRQEQTMIERLHKPSILSLPKAPPESTLPTTTAPKTIASAPPSTLSDSHPQGSPSPLRFTSKNPFIVHASSLGLRPRRTAIESKSIPVHTPVGHTGFVGQPQSIWRTNII